MNADFPRFLPPTGAIQVEPSASSSSSAVGLTPEEIQARFQALLQKRDEFLLKNEERKEVQESIKDYTIYKSNIFDLRAFFDWMIGIEAIANKTVLAFYYEANGNKKEALDCYVWLLKHGHQKLDHLYLSKCDELIDDYWDWAELYGRFGELYISDKVSLTAKTIAFVFNSFLQELASEQNKQAIFVAYDEGCDELKRFACKIGDSLFHLKNIRMISPALRSTTEDYSQPYRQIKDCSKVFILYTSQFIENCGNPGTCEFQGFRGLTFTQESVFVLP